MYICHYRSVFKYKFYESIFFYDINTTIKIKKYYNPASFICIDCDLYESAVPVFKFIEDFIQEGTIIYLDDYWVGYKGNPTKGVSRAFKEYLKFSESLKTAFIVSSLFWRVALVTFDK